MTLNKLIEEYNAHRVINHQDKKDWQPDRGDEVKFRRLRELLGEDKRISDINRDDTNFVRDHIAQLPNNSHGTRNMNIYKVIELTKAKAAKLAQDEARAVTSYKRLSSHQVNNHLTLYTSLQVWPLLNRG